MLCVDLILYLALLDKRLDPINRLRAPAQYSCKDQLWLLVCDREYDDVVMRRIPTVFIADENELERLTSTTPKANIPTKSRPIAVSPDSRVRR